MNTYSIILVASTLVCGLLQAADMHEVKKAEEAQQISTEARVAALIVSPSRSHSTPPRPITPPMDNRIIRKHSYSGSGGYILGKLSADYMKPLPEDYFRNH